MDQEQPAAPRQSLADLLERDPRRAFGLAQQAARQNPDNAPAIRLMAAALRRLGEPDRALVAERSALAAAERAPALAGALAALADNRVGVAERQVREHLAADPLDPAGLRLLADLAARAQRPADAEALLRRALSRMPAYTQAGTELAVLLHKQDRLDEALATLDALIERTPDPAIEHLKATLLAQGGRLDEALAISGALLERYPDEAKGWLVRGRWLRAVGRVEEAADAIRHALVLAPSSGDAWWAWADLKTARFEADDIAAMEQAQARADLPTRDRLLIAFALGKAYEDAGDAERAFASYAHGNALRRQAIPYDPAWVTSLVDRNIAVLDQPAPAVEVPGGEAPIFILGMHRAGSTLVEQILASHPAIEGLAELPQVRRLSEALRAEGPYPDFLGELDGARLAALGTDYLAGVAAHRHTDRPYFIDKMPGNWRDLPLILRMLPAARIIDVRRDPLDCCWSNFRQYYAQGQGQTYDLADLGAYYRDYVRMMAVVDAAAPGRVARVHYEALVADPEREVRRLLDYLQLPFDPACLRFYETDRAVRTPSAEQVRRPINARGIGVAEPYAAWLGPLRAALGDVLDAYPGVPALSR